MSTATASSPKKKGNRYSQAKWDDERTRFFLELIEFEILSGNRPNGVLTKMGWKNVVTKFNEHTKSSFTREQLKNKQDNLRREYMKWESLIGKETGLGWDPDRRTLTAPDEWWTERAAVDPGILKYKECGPVHLELFQKIFGGVTATGYRAYIPELSPERVPSDEPHLDGIQEEDVSENVDDDTPIDLTMPVENDIRPTAPAVVTSAMNPSKKRKRRAKVNKRSSADVFHSDMESLAIFLLILGQGVTYPVVEERVQRSSETVSNHFHMVLNAVCKLGRSIVRPSDETFCDIPSELLRNRQSMPFFKDCIGAIDGTHVAVHVPAGEKNPWFNRKGVTTTNVLAICDFDMRIIFAQVGMEGSMHDSRVLTESWRNPVRRFPFPPKGKYYLADAGYPLIKGFLTPYRSTRYHLPEFRANRNLQNPNEYFNYRHSSLRSVIERTFGVLKRRWRVLTNMSMVDLDSQLKIIWACITLHNFIRIFDRDDLELLGELPSEDNELSSILRKKEREEWFKEYKKEARVMETLRNNIRDAIVSEREV